jgi:hypothetical protein
VKLNLDERLEAACNDLSNFPREPEHNATSCLGCNLADAIENSRFIDPFVEDIILRKLNLYETALTLRSVIALAFLAGKSYGETESLEKLNVPGND